MNSNKAKQITDYIFREVFKLENPFTLEQIRQKFAFDIPPVKKVSCALSGKPTWTFSSPKGKLASQEAIASRFGQDQWLRKKRPLASIDQVLAAWEEINYLTAEKYLNCDQVAQSDGIYNSALVFQSVSVFDSKNIVFSYKIFDSNYLLACRDNSSCTLGVRVKESLYCSSCFEVSWSNKVSQSMFIHDGYDLQQCLFCSHLRSKEYCVANMQYSKEEYEVMERMVINWILDLKSVVR